MRRCDLCNRPRIRKVTKLTLEDGTSIGLICIHCVKRITARHYTSRMEAIASIFREWYDKLSTTEKMARTMKLSLVSELERQIFRPNPFFKQLQHAPTSGRGKYIYPVRWLGQPWPRKESAK